ncbi:MAG: DNA replication and repair protein RecF, partial [bacterium]|nr:DNA replication and repair protein RecF [bacterium]
INEYTEKIYEDISGLKGYKIKYNPNINYDIFDSNLKFLLKNEYEGKINYDIKMSSTSMGPHKDDFEFYLNDKNLKLYGSQGQQRLAVLALKLSEVEIFKKYKNTTPILLLDDIFSELDINKRNNLLKYISKDIQTIITTTDLDNLDNLLIKKSKLFKIENGKIQKIKEVS